MNIKDLVKDKNTTLIDVRETYEFEGGHAAGAINIPLSVIQGKVDDILGMPQPIVVYCRSGMRSSQALEFLRSMGVRDIYNAGGVDEVVSLQNG